MVDIVLRVFPEKQIASAVRSRERRDRLESRTRGESREAGGSGFDPSGLSGVLQRSSSEEKGQTLEQRRTPKTTTKTFRQLWPPRNYFGNGRRNSRARRSKRRRVDGFDLRETTDFEKAPAASRKKLKIDYAGRTAIQSGGYWDFIRDEHSPHGA